MPKVGCNRRLLYHCTHDMVASSTSTINSSRSRGEDPRSDALGLIQPVDRLHQRIVIGITHAVDRRRDPLQGQVFGESHRRVLTTGIRVVGQFPGHDGVLDPVAFPQRQVQRDAHQFHPAGGLGMPADDALGVYIDDESDIHPARRSVYIREIRYPLPVGGLGGDIPVEQIRGTVPGPSNRGAGFRPTPGDTVHPDQSHQPVNGAVRHRVTLTVQVGDHLSTAVQGFRGVLQAVEDMEDLRVCHRPGRRRSVLPVPVSPRRNLHALLTQDTTD